MNSIYFLALLLAVVFLSVSGAPVQEGDLQTRLRQFDLPRTAPTARIIKLSRKLTKKNGSKNLLSDKAGSFDNFEAFDGLEAGQEEAQDREATAPSQRRPSKEKNVGVFFPEDEIPE